MVILGLVLVGGIAYLILKPAAPRTVVIPPTPCNVGVSYNGIGLNATCSSLDKLGHSLKVGLTTAYTETRSILNSVQTGSQSVAKHFCIGACGSDPAAIFKASVLAKGEKDLAATQASGGTIPPTKEALTYLREQGVKSTWQGTPQPVKK